MTTEEEREKNDLDALENDRQRELYRKRKAARQKFNELYAEFVHAEMRLETARENLDQAERAFARAVGLGTATKLP